MDGRYSACFRDFLKVRKNLIVFQYEVEGMDWAISLHTAFQTFLRGFPSQVTYNYSFVEQEKNCQAEKMNNLEHYLKLIVGVGVTESVNFCQCSSRFCLDPRTAKLWPTNVCNW